MDSLKPFIDKWSSEFALNPKLVSAIIQVESAGDPWAVRYEATWRYLVTPAIFALKNNTTEKTEMILQSCSWGACQIMGSVARELGYLDPLPMLCDPDIGIQYGCKQLQRLSRKYKSMQDLAASYNAGTAIMLKTGSYFNQHYVNKVMALIKA